MRMGIQSTKTFNLQNSINVRVSDSVFKILKSIAISEERTVSAVARQLIESGLEIKKYKIKQHEVVS